MTALAEMLDQLRDQGRAYLDEGEAVVTVSNLAVRDAKRILAQCRALGWEAAVLDAGQTEWSAKTIRAKFAPFVVPIRKPPPPPGILQLLTSAGFWKYLAAGHTAQRWRIGRLAQSIRTWGILYSPWDSDEAFEPSPKTRSPKSLVRESGVERPVPADIRPWLLADDSTARSDDPAFQCWADASIRALIHCLPDEVDPEDQTLRFRGPPRLALTPPAATQPVAADLGPEGFATLQEAVRWVFEIDREAEMRHILLAAEVAHSGGGSDDAVSCVKKHIGASLQGARIAYQVSMSELSRDTLKLLAELRKAITEETAKVTEATRQIIASVAGALAIGLGLLAARVTAAAHPLLIGGVMLLTLAYVYIVIRSGEQFVELQEQLRRDWKARLYQFLPDEEYDRMVIGPAGKAETAFRSAAELGLGAVVVMTLVVIFLGGLAGRGPSGADVTANLAAPPATGPASERNALGPNGRPTEKTKS